MSDTKHELDTVVHAIKGTGPWMKDNEPQSSGGIVTLVAKRLRVTRATVYSYLKRWKTAKRALDDERENIIDLAEARLFKGVDEGNLTAIIFTLKTIGKSRGYVERHELDHGGDVNIKVRYGDDGTDG